MIDLEYYALKMREQDLRRINGRPRWHTNEPKAAKIRAASPSPLVVAGRALRRVAAAFVS